MVMEKWVHLHHYKIVKNLFSCHEKIYFAAQHIFTHEFQTIVIVHPP